MKKKLAIISTHPIQYYAPIFKLLADRKLIDVKVFYTWPQGAGEFTDMGFGKSVKWDIPLLDGYSYSLVKNVAQNPTSKNFKGIINPTLVKEIKEFNPGAILVFGWNFHSHLKTLRFFKGKVPVWFRGDSHMLNEGNGIKKVLRRLVLRWVYQHIDKAFYVGLNNKRYYLKHGVKEKNLIHAPHAIEISRFSSDSNVSFSYLNEIKQKLGIKDKDKVFLYCGKLEQVKNVSLLISAFVSVFHANSTVHLVMVGDGPLKAALIEKSSEIKNIHFLPFHNQSMMPTIYRLGNVFVLPSKSETWGLAVNEAMACGKAILVSDKVGCAVDLVQPSINGFSFKSNNREDLEEKMGLLLQSDLEEMGRKSRQIVQKFSFEQICTALEDELEGIE